MQSYLNSINPHARRKFAIRAIRSKLKMPLEIIDLIRIPLFLASLDENYVYETLKQIVNQSRLAPIDKKLLLQFRSVGLLVLVSLHKCILNLYYFPF